MSNPNGDNSNTQQKPPPGNTTKPEPADKSTVAGISTSNPDNPSSSSSSSESDIQQPPPPPTDNAATPTKPGNSAVGGVTTTTTETRTPNGSNSSGGSGGSNVRTPTTPTTPASGNTQLAISPTNPNGSNILPPAQNTNSVTPILPQSGPTTTIPETAVNPYPSVIPPVPTPPAINTVTPYVPIEITPTTPTPIPTDIPTTPTPTPTPTPDKPDPVPTPIKPEEKLLLIFDTNVSQFGEKDKQYMKKINPLKTLIKNHQQIVISASKTPSFNNKTFFGWNTERDGSGTFYYDGKKLLPAEAAALFGSKKVVTLYAQWNAPRNNKTLWEQMQYLIAKNVYNDYWYAAKAKFGGANPYQDSFIYSKKYEVNNEIAYYAEKIDLSEKDKWEGGRPIGEHERYYIDFYQSTETRFKAESSELNNKFPNVKGGHNYGNIRRAHALFNMNITYKVRDGYNDDPLYCRIEAEPYVSEPTPIRQIIINVNVDNTADDKRPLFFFYDGPDARTKQSNNGGGQPILEPEKAQPVILNLNADFKGVLWMPDIPVVINGNGHKFEGFIVAKEFRYLSTTEGVQVAYSSEGKTDKNYSDNKIHVDPSTGNVYTVKATGSNAKDLFTYNATDKFNLSSDSVFRKFTAEKELKYMYIFYDYSDNPTIDPTPFYDREGNLIPIYKYNEEGKEERIENWEDVKLYDENGIQIPKQISGNANKGSVRFDSKGNPAPVFDEAGNPIYFCDDYGQLDLPYNIFTLDKTHEQYEFLLTDTETLNVPNTEDWT